MSYLRVFLPLSFGLSCNILDTDHDLVLPLSLWVHLHIVWPMIYLPWMIRDESIFWRVFLWRRNCLVNVCNQQFQGLYFSWVYIPGTQTGLVLNGKGRVFESWPSKIEVVTWSKVDIAVIHRNQKSIIHVQLSDLDPSCQEDEFFWSGWLGSPVPSWKRCYTSEMGNV